MKYLIILTALISFTSTSFANTDKSYNEDVFNIYEQVYTNKLLETPCEDHAETCIIKVVKTSCKTNMGCAVVFKNYYDEDERAYVQAHEPMFKELKSKLKKAYLDRIFDIQRFGNKYRPSYELNYPLTCTYTQSSHKFSCKQ